MSLVEKIKALFNEANPNLEAAVATFVDVKSKDGSLLLRISALEVDGTVEIINEDGTLSPYAGEVVLEDGTEIVATEGKIVEVASPEAEVAEGEMATEAAVEVVEEVAAAEFAEGETPAKGAEDIASNLEGRITALETRISEIIELLKGKDAKAEEMETKVEVMSAENAELKAKNEELAKKTAAPAVSFKKFEKSEVISENKKLSLVERVAQLKENK
jgi:hypothetical protein